MKKKTLTVLVTGAASGIGRATAAAFAAAGHTVYALDRCRVRAEVGIHPIAADITKNEELLAAADALRIEGVHLDAILCVAGIHTMASLIESEPSDILRLLEVNLLGTMMCCRLFHPLLKEDGRILLVTSEVATYDPLPFNGLYNVSKVALESYAQALRQEMNLLGQKVITVRPGAVATPLASGTSGGARALADSTRLFRKEAPSFARLTERFIGVPVEPAVIGRLLLRVTEKRHPRLSYAKHRHLGLVLLSALPKRVQLAIVKLLVSREK